MTNRDKRLLKRVFKWAMKGTINPSKDYKFRAYHILWRDLERFKRVGKF